MNDELRTLMIAAIRDKHGEEVGNALTNLYEGIKRAETQIDELREGLRALLIFAQRADEQWHEDRGTGPYEPSVEIIQARELLEGS